MAQRGVAEHLNDAHLQQLVNQKTNKPVAFEYIPTTCDGKPVGIIRVALKQERPIYLRKSFGKLKPEEVYVRRGSSTEPAEPDEIAKMGEARVSVLMHPQIVVELADADRQNALGHDTRIKSRVLIEAPLARPLSDAEEEALLGPAVAQALRTHRAFNVPRLTAISSAIWSMDEPDPQKVAAYRKEMALLTPLAFKVSNVGQVLVNDVRLFAELPKRDGLHLLDRRPKKPHGRDYLGDIVPLAAQLRVTQRRTEVRNLPDRWELDVRVGKIQPNATAFSLPFWIGSESAACLSINVRAFADNVVEKVVVPITISVETEERWFDDYEPEPDDELGSD